MVSKQNFNKILKEDLESLLKLHPLDLIVLVIGGTVGKTLLKILSGYLSRHD